LLEVIRGIRAKSRRKDERGNALVEAVIVIPVLMLLAFGGIELGIGFSQKGGLESVARAGARKAATLTNVDNPPFHNQIGLETVNAVNAALAQTSLPQMKRMYVYRINGASGHSDGSGNNTQTGPSFMAGCGGSDCIFFDFDPATQQFSTSPNGTWPRDPIPSHRNACSLQADRVGVTIQGEFQFLTGLVGSGSINLNETAVLQLEPTICT
jgi:hypothetical protein